MPKEQPPALCNLESEAALIGAVLLGGNEVLNWHSVQHVKAVHFYDVRHQHVWRTFEKLRKANTAIDVLSVADKLGADGMDSVFVQSLVSACVSYVNADTYANIVIEHARRRYSEIVISQLGAAVYGNGRFEPALDQAIESLERIKYGGVDSALPWDIYTLHDAYTPREPLVYVVDGLFSIPSLSIVYGTPGCLKSMLLADMALCVSAGLPWLPSLPNARIQTAARRTVPVPVLWLDFDNGTRRTHERIDALASARELDANSTAFGYVSMPVPWLMADDEKSVGALGGLIRERNAGLVIVDNLGTVSGDADENSGDMIGVFANLRKLSEDTNAAVVVVHHQRKTTGYKTRAGESLRGHSSIEGAIDLALLIERDDRSPNISIKSTKTRGTDVIPFGAAFAYSHQDGTTELAKARFFGMLVEDKSKPGRAKRAVLEAIEDAVRPLNKGTLTNTAKMICDAQDGPSVGRQYVTDAITFLVQSGEIVETTTGRDNARIYSLVVRESAKEPRDVVF